VKRDRNDVVDGLTCRVGKHCPGILNRVTRGESLLLLGKPGSVDALRLLIDVHHRCGKSTLLREVASILADPAHGARRVHIVDTANEIA
jgi:stage III sporulation protein SpoIIIAA